MKRDFPRFMDRVGDLKKLKRTGWAKRGIEKPESVADHSYGTAMMALVLAVKAGVDQNKSVKMALVHDLAEAITGDPTPSDGITRAEKHHLEVEALTTICADIENGNELLALFDEYEQGESPEAQFVRRLDKLEMMFQAYKYGNDQPAVSLQEFWDYIQGFDFGNLKDTFDNLQQRRHGK